MTSIYISWAISAIVLLASAAWLGARTRKSGWGIFVDSRGRFSLTQMQLVLWTVVVLSLIVGVFIGRLTYGPARLAGALNFTIPNELLLVMGISIGSAAVSTAIKANKDAETKVNPSGPTVATRQLTEEPPKPAQAVCVEEGSAADQAIDITKFQNFWFTLILIAAYVATAITTIRDAGDPSRVTELPGFAATFVTLLGISHVGYLAGKLPDRPGIPAATISFEPRQAAVGSPITISGGGTVLTDVTEVLFGTSPGINLTHPSETTLRVEVPQGIAGQRVPIKLMARGWIATANDALSVA